MKISKELFIKSIENIQKQHEQESKFSDSVNEYFSQDVDSSLPRNYVLDSLVEMLQLHFNDNHSHSWIEYYLWELDFGKNYQEGRVKINDKDFELKTPTQLYELLITQ